jgi:hypothetical protein
MEKTEYVRINGVQDPQAEANFIELEKVIKQLSDRIKQLEDKK